VAYETNYDSLGTGSLTSSYTVRSTALGGEPLTMLTASGGKSTTLVPAGGLVFASGGQTAGYTQRDPVGVTETNKGVYDPLGNYIPFVPPSDPRPAPGSYNSSSMAGLSASLSNPNSYGMACYLNGIPINCTEAALMVNHDAAQVESILSVGGVSSTFSPGEVTPASEPDKTIPGSDDPTNPDDPLNPNYDGGTTIGYVNVKFFVSPGSQVTTTINPQKPSYPPGYPPVDINGIKKGIQGLSTKCKEYIAALINQAAKDARGKNPPVSTDIVDLLNDVLNGSGEIARRQGKSTVRGLISHKNASIYLSPYDPKATLDLGGVLINDTLGVVHELIHLSGKKRYYDDIDLARAASKLPGANPDFPTAKDNSNDAYGRYYDNELRNHCP
jgi:hypothetical protein